MLKTSVDKRKFCILGEAGDVGGPEDDIDLTGEDIQGGDVGRAAVVGNGAG